MMRHYTEVYDINTKLNSMTMLGIHTPQASALKKMFKGHFINYKKYKVIGCDIKIACASTLPLNAEQVGLESGEVDPRDVMNPMLFKACTGENLNALLNQIYNASQEESDELKNAIGSISEHINENVPSMRAYYQMLSDPTWRKAHPQAGITIRNLKPYVHKVVTTQPFKYTGIGAENGDGTPRIQATVANANAAGFGGPSGVEMTNTSNPTGTFDGANPSVFVSNGIAPMPWLDTAIPQTVTALGATVGDSAALVTKEAQWFINSVPRVYCGCLIMPPGVTTKFYMRMLIDWKIAFKDWRPAYEIGNIGSMQIVDTYNGITPVDATTNYTTYYNMYHDTETKNRMEDEQSSFTSNGAESELVYAS